MKNYILFLLLCVSFKVVQSQGTTNALKWNNGVLELVTVNTANGVINPVNTLPDIAQVTSGASTVNQSDQHYIFRGTDLNGTSRIYEIDLQTGAVINSPLLPEEATEFQYDCENDRVLGLLWASSLLQFISVNTLTGDVTNITDLPAITSIQLWSSAYNETSQTYVFYGAANNGIARLYELDAVTGAILNSPASAAEVIELQFNCKDNSLYGLTWDGFQENFVTVNSSTGDVIAINSLPGVSPVTVSTSSLWQTAGYYLFVGYDNTYIRRIYEINPVDGSIISNSQLAEELTETENNSCCSSIPTGYSIVEESFSIFPNPVSDELIIRGEAVTQVSDFTIVSLTGKVWYNESFDQVDQINLNVSKLPDGVYFLKLKTTSGFVIRKFDKE